MNVHSPKRVLRTVTITETLPGWPMSRSRPFLRSSIGSRGISDPTRGWVCWRSTFPISSQRDRRQSVRPEKSHRRSAHSDDHQSFFSFRNVVRARGYAAEWGEGASIFLCNSDEDTEKEIQYLRLLQRHRVAGILVSYVVRAADLQLLLWSSWIASRADRQPRLSSARTGTFRKLPVSNEITCDFRSSKLSVS